MHREAFVIKLNTANVAKACKTEQIGGTLYVVKVKNTRNMIDEV